jgi:hypothetical protein
MKVINTTIYNTADLRKLFYRVAEDELDTHQRKNLTIRVEYSRRRNGLMSGYAYYHGRDMTLRLPKPPKKMDLPTLAHLTAHEFAHIRGVRHRSMTHSKLYDWGKGWEEHYAYATNFPVRVTEAPQKPTTLTIMSQRYLHAQAALKRNQSKLKRQTTIVKKWAAKVKYYEKKMAATEVS